MMTSWLSLIAGLGLLYVGAQILVKGGAALALRLGLNALVVGLTVMAYGTSSRKWW
jgi:cation:H+ antiporter